MYWLLATATAAATAARAARQAAESKSQGAGPVLSTPPAPLQPPPGGDPSSLEFAVDSLLLMATAVGPAGPPLQAFLASLLARLVARWLRGMGVGSLEAAAMQGMRRGMGYSHLLLSLPTYIKLTVREWVIQQTRARVARGIPFRRGPALLLLRGARAASALMGGASVGPLFLGSPSVAASITPASLTPAVLPRAGGLMLLLSPPVQRGAMAGEAEGRDATNAFAASSSSSAADAETTGAATRSPSLPASASDRGEGGAGAPGVFTRAAVDARAGAGGEEWDMVVALPPCFCAVFAGVVRRAGTALAGVVQEGRPQRAVFERWAAFTAGPCSCSRAYDYLSPQPLGGAGAAAGTAEAPARRCVGGSAESAEGADEAQGEAPADGDAALFRFRSLAEALRVCAGVAAPLPLRALSRAAAAAAAACAARAPRSRTGGPGEALADSLSPACHGRPLLDGAASAPVLAKPAPPPCVANAAGRAWHSPLPDGLCTLPDPLARLQQLTYLL